MTTVVKIAIDTNFNYFGPSRPTISPFVISYFDLHAGDIVIGFQDDQEWEGSIGYAPNCPEEMEWYLDLNGSLEYSVTKEREQGRDEGRRASYPIGELSGEVAVASKMLSDGIDIDKVLNYTRLSRTRLENIKKELSEQNEK
ncbi:hypothetical protein C162_19544 [Paenibacillus sp. FSL R7-269]|uniref:hypothetical protein n=1 Tax=Paenibacillus sp. FSL R7-269 TaxID=1226755 RepID=UPI0003E1BBBE|nr:hypothetical protein [Paenibacillus sp. FSL R7-269]ETT46684.1 hypothetical protein C162_19544 [Paenibacillus sp. FSL R7-269]